MKLRELLADRFAVMDTGRVIDLATGGAVVLTITSAGGPTEQTRWATRCDALHKLRHRAIAPLVDYGAIADAQRFEAWRCGPIWTGARGQAEIVAARASAFLRACGFTAGGAMHLGVRSSDAGAVVLPDSDAGYPAEIDPLTVTPSSEIDGYGFVLVERRSVRALADLFEGDSVRPRAVAIWGSSGAGKSTVILEVARTARLRGFVPVAVPLFDLAVRSGLLRGRSLLMVDDEARGDAGGWARLLDASIQSPRPHVLILAGLEDVAGVDGVPLEPIAAASLVSSVLPTVTTRALASRVRHAAKQAGGLPGRFVRRLWRDAAGSHLPSRGMGTVTRAAEQLSVYRVDDSSADLRPAPPRDARMWPAPGELATIRRQADAACQLLRRGRHAPGERALRQAIGALARRGAWSHAGAGSLALASCLLTRGRIRDAQAVIDEARDHGVRSGDNGLMTDAAMLMGTAWIDLARLDEAESVLAAASAAERAKGSEPAAVVLAMARCLFWRGRYAEAEARMSSLVSTSYPPETDAVIVRAGVTVSRIAVGRRELARAVGTAIDAAGRARASGDALLLADASVGTAFAHLAVGDLDAVERDVADCLAAARIARDPLRGIRARLLLAESARRRGRRAAVTALIQRLSTLGGASLPPLVRARCALLKDLVSGATPEHEVVQRHVNATGLAALALFAPVGAQQSREAGAFDPMIEDAVEILRICQNAEEDGALLTDVCGRLRRQLHAVGVAFVAGEGRDLLTIATEGGRVDSGIAERAVRGGMAITPHRHLDRIEAAAPIKYGGEWIGALVARWALGSTYDRTRASAMLTMAAAAAAPAVAGAVSHRVQEHAGGTSGLLGESHLMAEVRRAIERAATAPFPVLIEGESGSGKELIARALHRSGPRRDRPLRTLNCAALPDDLIEAELFGHARGAFTGAVMERAGVFEEAHGGTLFLDEIGELSARAQAKVLRVIQEGELRRVGENVSRRVDVRIVAATNRDLRAEVAAARFRLDLLYRLDVIRIVIPPLRERREDIAMLADCFWRESAARVGSRASLASATVAALARYDWPGNVRELQNVLASLAVRSPKRGVVPPTALPPPFSEIGRAATWRLDQARRIFEERFVRAALVRTGGHRARAASELGVTRQGLTKLIARLGIGS